MTRQDAREPTAQTADPDHVSRPNRRRQGRGERRRAALLESLAQMLTNRPLSEIGIDEITVRAGVPRSTFYFYFRTKPAAVATLMGEVFGAVMAAASAFYERDDGTPRERLLESLSLAAQTWHDHGNLVRAFYDGAGYDHEIGALLEHWLDQCIDVTALRIEDERRAGRASPGADAHSLAAVLVGMNERAYLRDLRAGSPPKRIKSTVEALVGVWLGTLYQDLG